MNSGQRVSELMTRKVLTIAPNARLIDALEAMAEVRTSCILVCEEGTPIGIVSERDLAPLLVASERETCLNAPVRESMSHPVLTISDDASVEDAMDATKRLGIRRIVAVDDAGHLTGLITQSDLLSAYVESVEAARVNLEHLVAQRTAELEEANAQLQKQSLTDQLTGIENRRAMELVLEAIHEIAGRYGKDYCVALIDVDHFKRYNDHYGHQAGDEALRRVVQVLSGRLRDADRIFRYGGEEILVVLPETGLAGGRIAAEAMVEAVAEARVEHCKSDSGTLTVSIGVASSAHGADEAQPHWSAVVEAADEALYEAKEQGRNRAVTHRAPG